MSETRALATTEAAKLPTNVSQAMFDAMALQSGAGLENITRDDIALPFLGVLQKMSKAVDEEDTGHVDGAKAGMIINTVTREIFDSGLEIVPVFFEKKWVEWIPRNKGGGWVATWDSKEEAEKGRRADGGTEIIDTNNHYVLFRNKAGEWEAAILSCTSKKLKASRMWNAAQGRVTIPVGNEKRLAPSWSRRYILKTVSEKNDKGTYFTIVIDPVHPFEDGWVDMATFEVGSEFYRQVKSGAKKATYTQQDDPEPVPEPQAEDPDEPTF